MHWEQQSPLPSVPQQEAQTHMHLYQRRPLQIPQQPQQPQQSVLQIPQLPAQPLQPLQPQQQQQQQHLHLFLQQQRQQHAALRASQQQYPGPERQLPMQLLMHQLAQQQQLQAAQQQQPALSLPLPACLQQGPPGGLRSAQWQGAPWLPDGPLAVLPQAALQAAAALEDWAVSAPLLAPQHAQQQQSSPLPFWPGQPTTPPSVPTSYLPAVPVPPGAGDVLVHWLQPPPAWLPQQLPPAPLPAETLNMLDGPLSVRPQQRHVWHH